MVSSLISLGVLLERHTLALLLVKGEKHKEEGRAPISMKRNRLRKRRRNRKGRNRFKENDRKDYPLAIRARETFPKKHGIDSRDEQVRVRSKDCRSRSLCGFPKNVVVRYVSSFRVFFLPSLFSLFFSLSNDPTRDDHRQSNDPND